MKPQPSSSQPDNAKLRLKENLRFLLRQSGIPMTEVGRRAKVPRSCLYNWECGASPGDVSSIKRVAAIFNLSVDEICFADLVAKAMTPPALGIPLDLTCTHASMKFEVSVRRI